jgi:transposase
MACAKVVSQFEVLPVGDAGRRRGWTDEEKVRIVQESLRGYRQGSVTARRYGISRSLLTRWRKEHRLGLLEAGPPVPFSPVSIAPEQPRAAQVTPATRAAPETVEVTLVNGRRLTVPASIDPAALGRLIQVLERA